jgi:hypothetical protein
MSAYLKNPNRTYVEIQNATIDTGLAKPFLKPL